MTRGFDHDDLTRRQLDARLKPSSVVLQVLFVCCRCRLIVDHFLPLTFYARNVLHRLHSLPTPILEFESLEFRKIIPAQ